eukprot:NODE_75_length_23955_cov_0.435069.p6 type:complete len:370 gc:universal NODE_75_length_23955_cov_0.435069:2999-1890(-)
MRLYLFVLLAMVSAVSWIDEISTPTYNRIRGKVSDINPPLNYLDIVESALKDELTILHSFSVEEARAINKLNPTELLQKAKTEMPDSPYVAYLEDAIKSNNEFMNKVKKLQELLQHQGDPKGEPAIKAASKSLYDAIEIGRLDFLKDYPELATAIGLVENKRTLKLEEIHHLPMKDKLQKLSNLNKVLESNSLSQDVAGELKSFLTKDYIRRGLIVDFFKHHLENTEITKLFVSSQSATKQALSKIGIEIPLSAAKNSEAYAAKKRAELAAAAEMAADHSTGNVATTAERTARNAELAAEIAATRAEGTVENAVQKVSHWGNGKVAMATAAILATGTAATLFFRRGSKTDKASLNGKPLGADKTRVNKQ